MVRVQKRISVGMQFLQYFTMREWVFHNTKGLTIRNGMLPEDQKIFVLEYNDSVDKYLKNAILGARQYCMKESLSSLPKARRHQAM